MGHVDTENPSSTCVSQRYWVLTVTAHKCFPLPNPNVVSDALKSFEPLSSLPVRWGEEGFKHYVRLP